MQEQFSTSDLVRELRNMADRLEAGDSRRQEEKRAAWLANLRANGVRDRDGLLTFRNPVTGPVSVPVRMGVLCDDRR